MHNRLAKIALGALNLALGVLNLLVVIVFAPTFRATLDVHMAGS